MHQMPNVTESNSKTGVQHHETQAGRQKILRPFTTDSSTPTLDNLSAGFSHPRTPKTVLVLGRSAYLEACVQADANEELPSGIASGKSETNLSLLLRNHEI